MFVGKVLTPSGWESPQLGREIAAFNHNNRIVWRRITRVAHAETDLLTLHSNCLAWSVSPDCRMVAMGVNGHINSVLAQDVYQRWRASSSGQVKLQHITQAYPAELLGGNVVNVMQHFLLQHYGTPALPESAKRLLQGVPHRIVYPYLLLQDTNIANPLSVGVNVALQFVTRIWHLLKPISRSQCMLSMQSRAANFVQAMLFLAGITSLVRDDTLTVLLRTRSYSSPVKPVITPRTQILKGRGMAWAVDVLHPVVQYNGSAVVL